MSHSSRDLICFVPPSVLSFHTDSQLLTFHRNSTGNIRPNFSNSFLAYPSPRFANAVAGKTKTFVVNITSNTEGNNNDNIHKNNKNNKHVRPRNTEIELELYKPTLIRGKIYHGFHEFSPSKVTSYSIIDAKHQSNDQSYATPVLLLTGFGVGRFHYEKLVDLYINGGQDEYKTDSSTPRKIFTMDFFGQGDSWPLIDPTETPIHLYQDKPHKVDQERGFEHGFGTHVHEHFDGWSYSLEAWTMQVERFIEQVIGQPCLIAGNSLGGLVSVYLATQRPQLVKGLFLMNATPFWGTMARFPWKGTYPVPSYMKFIGTRLWNQIRNPQNISAMLNFVYKNDHEQHLVQKIMEPTLRPAAASAFCSILFSPAPSKPFNKMLQELQVHVCLAYGRDDPWVVPLWGQRIKRTLKHRCAKKCRPLSFR